MAANKTDLSGNRTLKETECIITGITDPFEITLDILMTAIITSIINAPTAFTAAIINIIIIYCVLRNVNLRRKSSNTLILCLAITDSIIGIVSQPLFLTRRVFVLLYHQEQCSLITAFNSISSACAGWSLTTLPVIGFERYLSVVHPIKHRNYITSGKILSVISVLWLAVFFVAIQIYWGSSYESYSFSVSIVIFLSITTCLGFYFAIFKSIVHQRQNVGAAMQDTVMQDQENQKREYKIAKNMAIIMSVLVLCYAPSLLAFSLNEHFGERIWWWENVFPWTDTFLFLNSTLNPLLYCWKNRELRSEVVKVVRCQRRDNGIQSLGI